MEELSRYRKKCHSQADFTQQDFLDRFHGKLHKVGRGGLMELFFPKNRTSVQSLHSTPRRNVYSVSSKSNKQSESVQLPKIIRTASQLQKQRVKLEINRSNVRSNPINRQRQQQRAKIQKLILLRN